MPGAQGSDPQWKDHTNWRKDRPGEKEGCAEARSSPIRESPVRLFEGVVAVAGESPTQMGGWT
jgi:hypothetical protein